jgi:aerobic-type carbon monoxide dehydrogenase small subunit (CoxS/CutS family)
MTDKHSMSMTVNGKHIDLIVESRRTLAEVLRDDLGLTGTHLGCEHGVCGACTVALDGRAVRSCLMLALQADGRAVETVEGLCADDGRLGPLQQTMADNHAFQCAFCAPGFLITVHCLLAEGREITREQIREELSGNLCRCTGYQTIVDGVEAAIAARQAGRDA